MALTGILKVTPEQMQQYSTRFGDSARQVQNKTNQMQATVQSLCCSWKGEASSAYQRKFNTLRDDMQRMYKMIIEHSNDLREMARNYTAAENNSINQINSLAEDVIV